MKVQKLGKLKYNIWLYFILFSVFIVGFVWIFQILLFDASFQQKKYENLVETGNNLASKLNTNEEISENLINNWLSLAVNANEAGVFTYLAFYDEDYSLKIETIFSGYLNANQDRDTEDKDLDNTLPNNSSSLTQSNSSIVGNSQSSSGEETSSSSQTNPSGAVSVYDESMISEAISLLSNSKNDYLCYKYEPQGADACFLYVSAVKNRTMDGYLVLKSSQQTLLETIEVLQTQLIIITACIIVVSFFVALYIANRLSKPIIEMSQTAKKWADGEENVVFESSSYQELSELASALNYAKEGINQTGSLQRDLLANVSHDLKTPLTMIKAYAEMIRDLSGEIKEKRDAHTKVIIDEADRLTMLVNDILDLSKLQNSTSDKTTYKQVNLSELCENVIYRFKDFAMASGFTILSEIEPDLFTECEESEIEQVIYNLIGNSINYTGPDKTIKVSLKKQDGVLLFETIDSGKGISSDKIETIWGKYYRYSETHQRPIKGTGLGLSIVRTILVKHNLKFGVISKKGVGSNFFIEFKGDLNE